MKYALRANARADPVLAQSNSREELMIIAINRGLAVIERYGCWLKKGYEIVEQ